MLVVKVAIFGKEKWCFILTSDFDHFKRLLLTQRVFDDVSQENDISGFVCFIICEMCRFLEKITSALFLKIIYGLFIRVKKQQHTGE